MSELESGRLVALSMAEAQELPQYRKISVSAVAGFLLGLLSPLALIHPVLWFVPVLGALVSIAGVRATRSGDPPLTGGVLAMLGLVLSMLFAGWAPARHVSRKATLERQSIAFTQYWFELVQARQLKQLHQLSRDPSHRKPPSVSLEEAYEFKPEEQGDISEENRMMALQMNPQSVLEQFLEEYPLRVLLAQARDGELSLAWKDPPPQGKKYARVSFHRIDELRRFTSEVDQMKLVYLWEINDGQQVRTLPLTLTIKRHRPLKSDVALWEQHSISAPR